MIMAEPSGNDCTSRRQRRSNLPRAVEILLAADDVAGEVYNCYDRYVSDYDVAITARDLAGSTSEIVGQQKRPANEISTARIAGAGDAVWRLAAAGADDRAIG